MANIFLSYEREDEVRARPIAKQLELAGHSVWWDRQIKGGGEFSAEIEAALAQADKVVVLWSERAVRSAWVRDEAAVGRDTGRLIPATIDGTPAPLGFRQFQTIDLSRRKGRGSSPEFHQLLNAIGNDGEVPAAAPITESKRPTRSVNRPVLFGSTIIALAVAGALVWHFLPSAAAGTPTFFVISGDSSTRSRQLSSDVAVRVAALDDPNGSDFHLVDAGAGGALTLVSRRSNAIIWSKPIEVLLGRSGDDAAQAAAMDAQRALSCTADALSYQREKIDQETLKLYLNSCTRFDAAYGTNVSDESVAKALEEVLAKAPHFAPAWSRLFAIVAEILSNPDREHMIATAKAQIARANRLGINVPEAFAVRAGILAPDDFLGILRTLDEGIRKHPESAFLFRLRGERYSYVGRMDDAVQDTGHAVQLDPLSPANQQAFAGELAYSGDAAAGYEQLRKAERLWPNSATVTMARYRLDLRFGDPKEAQTLYRALAANGVNPGQAALIEARINPTRQNIETALEAERRVNRQFPPFISSLVQALGYFGRKDEAIDLLINYPGAAPAHYKEWIGLNAEVLFRPMMRDVWRDPRSMAAAAHVGLLHYWKVSGKWPDFCFDPALPYQCKAEAAKYRA